MSTSCCSDDDDNDQVFESSLFLNEEYDTTTVRIGEHAAIEVSALRAASTDFDLTGQILWPCAEALCHFLASSNSPCVGNAVHNTTDQQRRRYRPVFVELGAGCGLSGLFASQLWPSSYGVLTDGIDVVCRLLNKNVAHHMQRVPEAQGRLTARRLEWNNADDCEQLLDALPFSSSEQEHDGDGSARGVDLVLAADVVQWPDGIGGLLGTARRLLGASTIDGGRDDEVAECDWKQPRRISNHDTAELLRTRPEQRKAIVCYIARYASIERLFLHHAALNRFAIGYIDMDAILPLDQQVFHNFRSEASPKIKLAVLILDDAACDL
jgi:hypothetical protein